MPKHLSNQADSDQPSHFLDKVKSTAERIRNEKQAQKEANEHKVEDVEKYKKALNDFAASENGKIVLKPLIRFMGIFANPATANTIDMVEHNGKRRVYLTMIRPFLEPSIRMELENL